MISGSARVGRITGFVLLDVLAIGAGMGVAIFAIAFGVPVVWMLPAFLGVRPPYPPRDLVAIVLGAALTSGVSFVLLAALWLPSLRMLRDPAANYAQFGMPLLLYEPLPSFIGWIVLMVVISPILQVLTTLFGAILRCGIRPVPRIDAGHVNG